LPDKEIRVDGRRRIRKGNIKARNEVNNMTINRQEIRNWKGPG
jgi:hypothetical protein